MPSNNDKDLADADVQQQHQQQQQQQQHEEENEGPRNCGEQLEEEISYELAVVAPSAPAPQSPPPPPPPSSSVQLAIVENHNLPIEKQQSRPVANDVQLQDSDRRQETKKKPIKIPAKQGAPNSLSVPEDNHLRSLDSSLANEDGQHGERKSSVVSFSDTCDLYEIDLEKGERNKELVRSKPACCNSIRYYVILLALLSPFVTTYSKTIINFAITDMIDPEFIEKKAANHSDISADAVSVPYFDRDNSCLVGDDIDRIRLIRENRNDIKRAQSGGEKFQWNSQVQGLIKSAYYFGHAPFQVPGSRMSEYYGSQRVMCISSMFISICCLLAPYLAATHFFLLFIDLFLLGVLGSFMTPALITLFSNWLTPSEKTIALTFYLVASRLGYALSSVICGELIHAQLSWRYVFFSAGAVSFVFSSMFFLCAKSRPQDHPLISQLELDYLATKNILVREGLATKRKEEEAKTKSGKCQVIEECELKTVTLENGFKKPTQTTLQTDQEGATSESVNANNHSTTSTLESTTSTKTGNKSNKSMKKAPWFAILTNGPVWAFVTTKFCVKLAGDTVQTELPTYLKRVMHYDSDANGLINGMMYVIFCCGCFLVGGLAKYVNKRRPYGLSKTALRKIFQSIASFGVSIALIGIAFSVCEYTSTTAFLMLMFFVTTFSTGGEAQIPLDITQRFPGTIHALGSSLAISGAIEPLIVGFFLKKHEADRERWRIVWLVASSIAATGGLVFLIFGDASVQPFDSIDSDEEEQEANNCEKKDGIANKHCELNQEREVVTEANGVVNEAFEKDNRTTEKARESAQL